LSALRTGHLYIRLSRPQGHSAAGRIMSMKNSNNTIGNRSRDLPVCSTVPKPLRHRVPPERNCRGTKIETRKLKRKICIYFAYVLSRVREINGLKLNLLVHWRQRRNEIPTKNVSMNTWYLHVKQVQIRLTRFRQLVELVCNLYITL
jgi:hypothetical protein